MTEDASEVIGDVDTHGHAHHTSVIDVLGRHLADRALPATGADYRELEMRLHSHGTDKAVGIARTGAHGYFDLGDALPGKIHMAVTGRFRSSAPVDVVVHKAELAGSDAHRDDIHRGSSASTGRRDVRSSDATSLPSVERSRSGVIRGSERRNVRPPVMAARPVSA